MLNWAQQFSIFCFLDNHDYDLLPHNWDCLLGADALGKINGDECALADIDDFLANNKWSFGHIGYEALHQHYGIKSSKPSSLSFPDFFFFEPRYLLRIKEGILYIDGPNADEVFASINQGHVPSLSAQNNIGGFESFLNRETYIAAVEKLLNHIQRGDCYEINFCQEFFAENATINPLATYLQLASLSPNPYAAFYKWQDQYLICASPERYLSKRGLQLLSQPMKGTAPRLPHDTERDAASKESLLLSQKDRSENVMVVDMVRNDLSRICKDVSVTELFGIQSFPYVHQMVSTIRGTLLKNIPFAHIFKATFPMGSMTGAPKKKVMELIERYEMQKRGIFSGAVGYFSPGADFDFNVVIRSIMYNSHTGYLSYQVGSGITTYSQPEKEWEECLLKAEAIKKVLTG